MVFALESTIGSASATEEGTSGYQVKVTKVGEQSGAATIGISVNDGNTTSRKDFTINVIPNNSVPIANDSNSKMLEDTTFTFTPEAFKFSDVDSNNTLLTKGKKLEGVKLFNTNLVGELILNDEPYSDGELILTADITKLKYKPEANFSGENVEFEYYVFDGVDYSKESAKLSLYVENVDDAPILKEIADLNLNEDHNDMFIGYNISELNSTMAEAYNKQFIDIVGTDVENDKITYEVKTDSEDVDAFIINNQIIFKPTYNFNGSVEVTLTAYSKDLNTTEKFNLNIAPVNDAPVFMNVEDINVTEDSNETKKILVGDAELSDISVAMESNDTSILKVLPLWNGMIDSNAQLGGVKYAIETQKDAYGEVEISVTSSDGEEESTETFIVNVLPVNDAPQIEAIENFNKEEDFAPFSVDVNVSDIDLDELNVTATTSSNIITLKPTWSNSLNATQYKDALSLGVNSVADKFGSAEVNVEVEDRDGLKNSTSFTIQVPAVVDFPTLSVDKKVDLSEDFEDYNVTLEGVSGDGEDFNITVTLDNPSLAEVVQNWPATITKDGDFTLTLKSKPDVFGTTKAKVVVDNGTTPVEKEFEVSITPINDKPIIEEIGAINKAEDFKAFDINISASDVDKDNLTYKILSSNKDAATITNTNNTLHVEPILNANGTTKVTVIVDDGNTTSTKDFELKVVAVDDLPTIEKIEDIDVKEDSSPQSVLFKGKDVEGDYITYEVTSSDESKLKAKITSVGSLDVTPQKDATGEVTITVIATSNGKQTQSSFKVNLTNVNDAPTSESFSQNITDSTIVTFSATDFVFNDIDTQDSLKTIKVESLPVGSLELNGRQIEINEEINATDLAQLKYNPAALTTSLDLFKFRVSDGELYSVNSYEAKFRVDNIEAEKTLYYSINENDSNATIDLTLPGTKTNEYKYDVDTSTTDGQYFNFDATTNMLSFTTAKDYENPEDENGDNTYNVTFKATNDIGLVKTRDLEISVTDINNISDDSDGNGVSDNDENSGNNDLDDDGILNHLDDDNDNDGISDKDEGSSDYDGDGIANFNDSDSDNDGISDKTEGSKDSDNDGKPDSIDMNLASTLGGIKRITNNIPLTVEFIVKTNSDAQNDLVVTPSTNSELIDSVSAPIIKPISTLDSSVSFTYTLVSKDNKSGVDKAVVVEITNGVETIKPTFELQVGEELILNEIRNNENEDGSYTNRYYDRLGQTFDSNITAPNGWITPNDGNVTIRSGEEFGADMKVSVQPYNSHIEYKAANPLVTKATVDVKDATASYDFDENGKLNISSGNATVDIVPADGNVTTQSVVNGVVSKTVFNVTDSNTTIDESGNVRTSAQISVPAPSTCGDINITTTTKQNGMQTFSIFNATENNASNIFTPTPGTLTVVSSDGDITNDSFFSESGEDYKLVTSLSCDGTLTTQKYIKRDDEWVLEGTLVTVAKAGEFGSKKVEGDELIAVPVNYNPTSYEVQSSTDYKTVVNSETKASPTIINNGDGFKAISETEMGLTIETATRLDGFTTHKIVSEDGVSTEATSEIEGSETTLMDSGVVTKVALNNIDVNTTAAQDGSATHYLKAKIVDAFNNAVEAVVEAVSKIIGAKTVVEKDDDGEAQVVTSVSKTNDLGTKVDLAVTATSSAGAIHSMKFTDADGKDVEVKADFNVTGAYTEIKEDGSIETNTTQKIGDTTAVFKAEVDKDGYATHIVKFNSKDSGGAENNGTTTVTSQYQGATTTLNDKGEIETDVTDSNGVKAVVKTFVGAKSEIKFFDKDGKEIKLYNATVTFPQDSNITIKDDNGIISTQTIAPLNSDLKL
ncbi:MAG: tandem-95 repeat protein [Campylobacterota bacterium]|nr:tandem-95 repeat protein [Campylobacterota bacterium]